eukprot:SAG25_NODE_207_length_11874_cov_27.396773_7_plen_210_part_00
MADRYAAAGGCWWLGPRASRPQGSSRIKDPPSPSLPQPCTDALLPHCRRQAVLDLATAVVRVRQYEGHTHTTAVLYSPSGRKGTPRGHSGGLPPQGDGFEAAPPPWRHAQHAPGARALGAGCEKRSRWRARWAHQDSLSQTAAARMACLCGLCSSCDGSEANTRRALWQGRAPGAVPACPSSSIVTLSPTPPPLAPPVVNFIVKTALIS